MLTYHKTTEEEKYRITAWKYDGDYAIYNSTGQERGWNIIMIVWGSLLTLSIVVYCVYQTVKYLIQNRDEKRK